MLRYGCAGSLLPSEGVAWGALYLTQKLALTPSLLATLFLGTNLLEVSVGRDFGALKGLIKNQGFSRVGSEQVDLTQAVRLGNLLTRPELTHDISITCSAHPSRSASF